MYKIYSFFWTRGVGFLFLLRWAGPLGMRCVRVSPSGRAMELYRANSGIRNAEVGLVASTALSGGPLIHCQAEHGE